MNLIDLADCWFERTTSEGPFTLREVQRFIGDDPKSAKAYHCCGFLYSEFQDLMKACAQQGVRIIAPSSHPTKMKGASKELCLSDG